MAEKLIHQLNKFMENRNLCTCMEYDCC